MRLALPYTRAATKLAHQTLHEEIAFTYLRIQWTWQQPLLTSTDDWLVAR